MRRSASERRLWRRVKRLAVISIVMVMACSRGEQGDAALPPDSLAPPAAPRPTVDSGAATDATAPHADAMEALRAAVARELGQPVTLEVDKRHEDARWTFVTAVARTMDRKPVDYTRTKFADAVKGGIFDDWLCALLEREGAGWKVVALEIGATDVPYVDWPERFGVPRELVLPRSR